MERRSKEPTVPGLKPERRTEAASAKPDPDPVRLSPDIKDVGSITDEAELLRSPLLDFGAGLWTIGDAFEGLQVFGSTGSGKSSGSGHAVLRSFLQSGFGGLVLCAKSDEPDQWRKYVKKYGRGQRLREFGPAADSGFNFLDYEYNRENGELTHDVVSVFLNALSSGQGALSTVDPYWAEALREMLTHAVDLVALGTKAELDRPTVTLHDLLRVVQSAPLSRAEEASPTWRSQSYCWQLIEKADSLVTSDRVHKDKKRSLARTRDLEDTFSYWRNAFPGLSDRTRSIVVSSFTSKATGLLRSPLRELFCAAPSDAFLPERTFEGDIILLNLPLKEFGEVGRFAQVLYKTIWQRAAERRVRLFSRARRGEAITPRERSQMRPVFLWADESQYFVSGEDARFQQTARAARTATVYLTQNLPNYYSMLADRHATASTDSLLGNLQTKILHANGDPTTNEWAERLFGKHWISMPTTAHGSSDSMSGGGDLTLGGSKQTSVAWHYSPVMEARMFSTLRSGGERHEYEVQAYLYQASRTWGVSDGQAINVIAVTFKQELDDNDSRIP